MKQINKYILEKLKIDKTPISKQPYDFEIDLDSMSNANACMNSIKKNIWKNWYYS